MKHHEATLSELFRIDQLAFDRRRPRVIANATLIYVGRHRYGLPTPEGEGRRAHGGSCLDLQGQERTCS